MSDLVVSVNVGCFYFFREICFLKSGTIEGKRILIAGLKILLYRGLI